MTTRKSKRFLFNLRLTPMVKEKMDELAQVVGKSRAAVVRALILNATLADLPRTWTAVSEEEKLLMHEVER